MERPINRADIGGTSLDNLITDIISLSSSLLVK